MTLTTIYAIYASIVTLVFVGVLARYCLTKLGKRWRERRAERKWKVKR